MKATKKQISEVTRIANERGYNVTETLASLERVSKGIFDVIGIEGFFETLAEVAAKKEVERSGYYVSLKKDLSHKKFWVAKSLVVDSYFPSWVAKK